MLSDISPYFIDKTSDSCAGTKVAFLECFTAMTSTKDRYDCSNKHRGYALIFANEDVEPKRKWALDDEMYMTELLRHLKFFVINRSDLSAKEIVQILNEVLKEKEFLENSDCFVCVISTHGREIPSPDGKTYQQELSCIGETSITTQEIVRMVSECEALEGKPKLFFIQACRVRGKIDTQEGRDPGHIVHVKKEDSHDETNQSPKHSPAQLHVGHTMDVRSEEARPKLANLVINCDGQNSASATTDEDSQLPAAVNMEMGQSMPDSSFPMDTADESQNSASATTDEDSQLPAVVNMEMGQSMPDSSFPMDTADESQNSASATTDEDSQLPAAMNMKIGHSMPDFSFPKDTAYASQNSASTITDEDSKLSSLPVDAGQNLAPTTTDQASIDPAAKMVEKSPVMHHLSCPKDTLIMYAIPPGYTARRQLDGAVCLSVMLKELKNALTNIPEEKSLLAALTEVQGKVSRDYEYSLDMPDYDVENLTEEERRGKTLYKLVPQINHRLLYHFYFTKKDDRFNL